MQGGVRNDLTASSSYRNNVRETSSAWVRMSWRPVTSVEGIFSVSYSHEEHEDSVDVGGGEMRKPKNDAGTVSAKLTYAAPVRFLSLFAETSYTMVESNISDYNEVRTSAGVTARY
jgi:hypothetical protein